jgi:hypothetical protein
MNTPPQAEPPFNFSRREDSASATKVQGWATSFQLQEPTDGHFLMLLR